MKTLPVTLLALLLAAGGCVAGGCAAHPSPQPPSAAFAPDDLVLRVRAYGGFVPASVAVTEVPQISVYGDGRVISVGAVPAIYPGPALPALEIRHIGQADVARLIQLALDAGVGTATDLGVPNVTDAPRTEFTVLTASGPKSTRVEALGIGADESFTDAQRAARAKLQDLTIDLTDLPRALGDRALGEPQPYVPKSLAAVAIAWAAGNDPVLRDPPPVAWPGPELPGSPLLTGSVNCVTVTGDQVTRVLAAAKTASARTPWTSAGKSWTVIFRPLLPQESDCSDLI